MQTYDREAAVRYAHEWAFGRNPAYYDYDAIGGDCSNFTSQVLFAGAGVMDYTPTFGWYYRTANDKAPAWTGVEYLARFLTNPNKKAGPQGVLSKLEDLQPGDLVQLSFDGVHFSHCPVVVAVGAVPSAENLLLAAHSYNSDNRPLSTYSYQIARFYHIFGVKKN